MKARWAEADRREEVRAAASSWREARIIDDDTLGRIEAIYPGRRLRLALIWRILIFLLVTVAVHAAFWSVFLFADFSTTGLAARCLFYGALLAVATELLHDTRLAATGCDAAASFWAIGYFVAGSGLFLSETMRMDDELALTLALLLAGVLFGAACRRWGHEGYGALGAAALFLFLARFDGGRLFWIVVAPVAIAFAARRLDSAALTPSHRRAFAGVLAVSALALYTAVNRYALDERWIERMTPFARPSGAPGSLHGVLASTATAILPVVFIAWGIRSRRLLLLDLGALSAALSVATLRYYVHFAPLWAVLLTSGAALILLALALNRSLRRAPGGERNGFTAAPLFRGREAEGFQTAAVVAGFAPEASHAPEAGRDGLSTGGGRFGGGGANGSF